MTAKSKDTIAAPEEGGAMFVLPPTPVNREIESVEQLDDGSGVVVRYAELPAHENDAEHVWQPMGYGVSSEESDETPAGRFRHDGCRCGARRNVAAADDEQLQTFHPSHVHDFACAACGSTLEETR